MELAAIQLNMRVFSDQHLDDPVARCRPGGCRDGAYGGEA
jgi:hypothetical protein